ncbi:synaptophysin isoform X1 [Apteryx mantelli]|uniref:Synaptophysin n=1 Tax=Apteryx mantelli TaxID=2696672 RepID=A0ABM4G1X1_9AVES
MAPAPGIDARQASTWRRPRRRGPPGPQHGAAPGVETRQNPNMASSRGGLNASLPPFCAGPLGGAVPAAHARAAPAALPRARARARELCVGGRRGCSRLAPPLPPPRRARAAVPVRRRSPRRRRAASPRARSDGGAEPAGGRGPVPGDQGAAGLPEAAGVALLHLRLRHLRQLLGLLPPQRRMCHPQREQPQHRRRLRLPLQGAGQEKVFLVGDYSSAAEFFVTVAVFAFLYALGALGVYLFLDSKYRENNKGPVIDLVATGALAFLWLVSSCAWAKALADVKEATAPAGVLAELPGCRRPGARCRGLRAPLTSGLNTSVVFGFLNLVLWTGNVWFVFKETGWGGPWGRGPPAGAPEKQAAPEGGYGGGGGYGQPEGGYGQPGGGGGGYQPDYGQGGYGPPEGGYGQGAPTSFANQM